MGSIYSAPGSSEGTRCERDCGLDIFLGRRFLFFRYEGSDASVCLLSFLFGRFSTWY